MTAPANHFGLSDRCIATIRDILVHHPEVETAILYGSRAIGSHRPGSDIDLTLTGPTLKHRHLMAIAGALEESDIPYTVDLSLREHIDNPKVLAHIARVGMVFYSHG